jgi:hypothetical protein
MKKMIVTLAIALSSFAAFAGEENVNPQVLNAFKEEFTTAKEVEWTVGKNYYKASFVYNDKHFFAWYDMDGEMIGLSRYVSPVDLPAKLQSNLKKQYSDYWISDLFEVTKNEGTAYFVTLENADSKIVLKSSGLHWSIYQKIKKA